MSNWWHRHADGHEDSAPAMKADASTQDTSSIYTFVWPQGDVYPAVIWVHVVEGLRCYMKEAITDPDTAVCLLRQGVDQIGTHCWLPSARVVGSTAQDFRIRVYREWKPTPNLLPHLEFREYRGHDVVIGGFVLAAFFEDSVVKEYFFQIHDTLRALDIAWFEAGGSL